jgi:hypothetical protein
MMTSFAYTPVRHHMPRYVALRIPSVIVLFDTVVERNSPGA